MAKKYKVYDSTGTLLRTYDSYIGAHGYRMTMGRPDWHIECVNT